MSTSFTPVSYDFREDIQEQIANSKSGKIFFWSENDTVDEANGQITELRDTPGSGMFIVLDNNFPIRIDRIITLYGRPGAAYEEYDSFANQCLACTAGVPL